MMWLRKLLQRLRVFPSYSQDDYINASMEDTSRGHEKAVRAVTDAANARSQSSQRLRKSIKEASERTGAFIEFERVITHLKEHQRADH